MDKEKELKNKPLTVEELKSLKKGNWLWVTHIKDNQSCYEKIAGIEKSRVLFYGADLSTTFATYGTKWIAYKNKEEAENAGYGNVKQAVKEFADYLSDYTKACQEAGYDGIGAKDIQDKFKELYGEE